LIQMFFWSVSQISKEVLSEVFSHLREPL